MNTEAKILLTINLEGGALLRGKPEVRKYYLTKKDLFPKQKFKGNDGNKVIKSGKYTTVPLIPSEAKQKITMCKEAYDYFISSQCPQWFHSPKDWRKMSDKERLELHLSRTCMHFGGKSFTYQIVED